MTVVVGQGSGTGCSTLDPNGPNSGSRTGGAGCSTLEQGSLKKPPTEPFYTAGGIALIRQGYQVKQDGSGQKLNENLGYDQTARLKLSEILTQSSGDTEFTLKGFKVTISSKGPQGTSQQEGFSYITITPPTGSSEKAMTVRVHNASGDLSDPSNGRPTSISPHEQNKINALFAKFRNELLSLKVEKKENSATRQIPPVGPDKKSKELADLAAELENSTQTESKIGTLIVKSEKPPASQNSQQKPSDHRILTLKGLEGPTKDVVATVTLANNTGEISAATLAGKPLDLEKESDRSKLNELLAQLNQPTSTPPQKPQAPAPTTRLTQLAVDGVVHEDEKKLLKDLFSNQKFLDFLKGRGFEDKDGQLTKVDQVQNKPRRISLNKTSGSVTISIDGRPASEKEHISSAEELINQQIKSYKDSLLRPGVPPVPRT